MDREERAVRYRYRVRQRRSRRVGAFVQRLVVGAVVCMTAAVLLAVMTGALH